MEIIDEFIVNQLNDKDSHNDIISDKRYKLLYVTDNSRKFIYTLIDDKIYGLQLNHLAYNNYHLMNFKNNKIYNLDKNVKNESKEMFIKIEKGYVYLYITIYSCYCLFQTNNTYLENNKDLFTIQDGYILK